MKQGDMAAVSPDRHTVKQIHNKITKLAAGFHWSTPFCKCYGKVNISNNGRKNNTVRKYTLYMF